MFGWYYDCCDATRLLRLFPLFVLTLAGCSDSPRTYPITGTIKLANGEPLSGGRILFQPTGEASQPARGLVAADGTFEVGTFRADDGAVPGVHKVAVYPLIPEEAVNDPVALARYKGAFDQRYQNIQTTPLELTVRDDGSANHFDIVLK